MPDGPAHATTTLPWLAAGTQDAMRAAWVAAHPDRAEAAARDVVLARHPALPFSLLDEAVELVTRR
ncbi:hypothetical protein [Plastoroseomonas arctica]|uniref:Uncharacterized protein n=1 Tax=Plastoroseomonas arctica TaxID=1509237 RepID=A0AAF1JZQ5_9PROT|nr:hypothetical protein [Plastoroseomonas arctica]MBR0656986.1 hypothetical protein [Plastoroseomonas arctica]